MNSAYEPVEAALAVFERNSANGTWMPSAFARGPFVGLQGGAVAGLLTAEIEQVVADRELGTPAHVAAWFFRPAPLQPLRTRFQVLYTGGRMSVVENTLFVDGKDEPCATARVTVMRDRAVDIAIPKPIIVPADPTIFPAREVPAPHAGNWFMNTMEMRVGEDGTVWFRVSMPVIAEAGVLSTILGPSDWAHGLNRPVHGVVADPNVNLNVHLLRPPQGQWFGIQASTQWHPERGAGVGRATLLDIDGEIGCISMSVALTPFPTALPDKAQLSA